MEYYNVSKKQKILKLITIFCFFALVICTFIINKLAWIKKEKIKENEYEVSGIRSSYKSIEEPKILEEKSEKISIQEKIEKINHSVVGISKIKNTEGTIFLPEGTKELGLGTGIILSKNGYILTNAHLSGEKYSNCYVTLDLGNRYNADVVWKDDALDLAILKINGNNFPKIELGDSNKIKVAEEVYAIGNPIGYEFQKTVTKGIISAKDRTVKFNEDGKEIYMSNLIQTDATINTGNSGGPLINNNGEVIGINTIKITSAEGIGFAVPINIIKPIIKKLENEEKFEQATLGIFAFDKNVLPYLEEDLDFKKGIYIENININSPAEKAGILKKDIITKIDNKNIEKMSDLREYIFNKKPGDTVKITIQRNNIEKEIEVILDKKS